MREVTLDNRGLQAPEPLVRILEALAGLGDGDRLVAYMDREPLLLYSELERRGWTWDFSSDGGSGVLRVSRDAEV